MNRARRATIIGAIAAGSFAIAFGLLLLTHDPLVYWNDDYELSILPVCADIARAWDHGEFPLLSPYSWICGNLAGEFQYGVFSIFINALIICIWKFPLVFSEQAAALAITQLAVLAAGGFMLGHGRNLSIAHSVLIGLVASVNGWIVCWGATDWFGALGAFTWLPWAWWAAERSLDCRGSRWRFLWPVPFVYLLVTGGFPYTVLMLVLVLIWLTTRAVYETRTLRTIFPLLCGTALGFGLSAPAWLALLDYVHGSARQLPDSAAHFQWLVPPNAWPALILPCWTVKWADFFSRMMPHAGTELACGLVPPAALIAGVVAKGRLLWRNLRWELGLLLVVLLLAMMPTAGVFRWSFRWLPLFHLILVLCAAEALRLLPAGEIARPLARPGFLALVLVAITAATMRWLEVGGTYALPLTWIFLSIALVWMAIELAWPKSTLLRDWMPTAVGFAALLTTYFCIPPNSGVPKYNFSQNLLNLAPLDSARLYLSIYPPPESAYRIEARHDPVGQTVRPGSGPMWARLRFINGYSPIRPAGVARQFASAIHGEIDLSTASWLLSNEGSSAGLLSRIGIDGIIVAREFSFVPQPASEWMLAVETDEGRVFHRRGDPIPAIRSLDLDGKHPTASVTDVLESRNSCSASVVTGDQPALITFSRPFFRGYQARIGGRQLAVNSYRELTPVVEVPAKTSGRLVVRYRPAWLVIGVTLAILSGSIWLVSLLLAARSPAPGRAQ